MITIFNNRLSEQSRFLMDLISIKMLLIIWDKDDEQTKPKQFKIFTKPGTMKLKEDGSNFLWWKEQVTKLLESLIRCMLSHRKYNNCLYNCTDVIQLLTSLVNSLD